MVSVNKNLTSACIKNEIYSLTSFRFIIALIVFLFHCKIHFGYQFGVKIIDNFLVNGAVFMTAFFVLSGYILSYVYSKNKFNGQEEIFIFYVKRVAKIYPVYILATIIYFIFIKPDIPYSAGDWLRISVNDLFLIQAFFPSMFQLGINGGTWSISVEMFFYLFFPLFLILFKKKPFALLWIGLGLTMIISINIYGEIHSSRSNVNFFYANPIMRINEFMIGMAFYLLGERNRFNQLPGFSKSSFLMFLLVCVLVSFKKSNGGHSYMGLQVFLIPLFGLLVYNLHYAKRNVLMNSRLVNYLGKISYSFYIWQFIAIHFGIYIKKHFPINGWFIMLIALFINIVISAVSYHCIEEKFRKHILKYLTLTKIKDKVSTKFA